MVSSILQSVSGRTLGNVAATLDGLPYSAHYTIGRRAVLLVILACLFFAYRDASDLLWGNFSLTGKVVE